MTIRGIAIRGALATMTVAGALPCDSAVAATGGVAAAPRTWAWQVALVTAPKTPDESARSRFVCGGTLVAPTVVLTASHCLYDRTGAMRAATSLDMITGRTRLSDRGGQELPMTQYLLPSTRSGRGLYERATTRWDVAAIELRLRSRSKPIKLADASDRQFWKPRATAYVAGRGALGPARGPADSLQVVRLPILTDSACAAAFPGEFDRDVMLCTGCRGRDPCTGHSGGPLVVQAGRGRFRLIGSISWGLELCGRHPAVYPRLAAQPMRTVVRQMVWDLAGVDIVAPAASN